ERVERDEVDGADAARVDDVAHRAHRRRVLVVVDREEDAPLLQRRFEHRLGLARRGRERLLAQDVEAARDGVARDRRVVLRRRGDVDEVEAALGAHERLRVFVDARLWKKLSRQLAPRGADIGDGDDHEVAAGEVRREMSLLGDEPEPYDRALATGLHDREHVAKLLDRVKAREFLAKARIRPCGQSASSYWLRS